MPPVGTADGWPALLGLPLGWCMGFHGQRMHFVGLHAIAQSGIDLALALHQVQTVEFSRNNGGKPMAAIALQFDVLASEALLNQGLEFFCGHNSRGEKVKRQGAGQYKPGKVLQ